MKKLAIKTIKNIKTIKGGEDTTPEITMSQLNIVAPRPSK